MEVGGIVEVHVDSHQDIFRKFVGQLSQPHNDEICTYDDSHWMFHLFDRFLRFFGH